MPRKQKEIRQLYTIPVAAKKAGVPDRTVRFAIKRGEIPFETVEGTTIRLVAVEDIQYWKEHPESHRPGPKKPRNKSI
jgi:excisionase family DNA binding protein